MNIHPDKNIPLSETIQKILKNKLIPGNTSEGQIPEKP